MTNLNQDLINRVTETYQTNKKPCKMYATQAAAEKATAIAAQNVANSFYAPRLNNPEATAKPANWIVVFVPAAQKWVGGIQLSEVLSRPDSTGGYLGVEMGFYKF